MYRESRAGRDPGNFPAAGVQRGNSACRRTFPDDAVIQHLVDFIKALGAIYRLPYLSYMSINHLTCQVGCSIFSQSVIQYPMTSSPRNMA